MFLKRIQKYAVKTLKSGAARLYIQNSDALRKSGLSENTRFRIQYSKNSITIIADKSGDNKIMDTGRGALLELKNKKTAESIGHLNFVNATFKDGKIIISVHFADKKKMEREQSLFTALSNGQPLRKTSLFSGLGMLSYQIKVGLDKAGIKSEITFANDACDIAMECNLAGNPMWDDASHDAFAVVDTLGNLDLSDIPQSHFMDIGYPCVGQSTLCAKENRDLAHPIVGTLFVKLLAAIEAVNPAIVLFENTPAFVNSQTLSIIKREMVGYRFEEVTLNAHEFGEMEARKRVCVVAVSDGLPALNLASLTPGKQVKHDILSDFMEEVPLDSPLWRTMDHVKKKELNPRLNYKNMLYKGHENLIAALTATYNSPKAGAPMIAHPLDNTLQRQLTVKEHARIRRLPQRMYDQVISLADGTHSMTSARGSKQAAHRVLGNGVSKYVWNAVGEFLGNYLTKLKPA